MYILASSICVVDDANGIHAYRLLEVCTVYHSYQIDATRLSAQHQALVSDQVVKWLSFVKAHIWKFALKNQTVHMFKTSAVDRTLLPHLQICYT